MRRTRKIIILLAALLLMVLLCAPPLLGAVMEKMTYRYLSASELPIDIIKYERGWFTSKITARVRVPELKVHQLLGKLGFLVDAPEALELTVKGHVWHGPILYSNYARLDQLFGIAAIDRKMFVPSEQQKIFALLGLDNSVLKSDHSYISFFGNFSENFEFVNYIAVSPVGTSLRFSSFNGKISYNPFLHRIKGNVTLDNFAMSDNTVVIYLPVASTKFDLKKDEFGLWIGKKEFSLPQITGRDTTTKLFEISGVQGKGLAKEAHELIDLESQLEVEKIEWADTIYGPLDFKIKANGFSIPAITNVFNVYQQITQTGEMYEGQLEQKMMTLIASTFVPGATIEISQLKFKAPEGDVDTKLEVTWPEQNPSPPERLADLIQSSYLKGDIRITKTLVAQLIDLFSRYNYADQIPLNEREKLMYLQDCVRIGTEQNAYLIIALIQGNAIPRDEGVFLLTQIRNGTPLENYVDEVQGLFLAKKIAPDTSYFLVWQYANLYSTAEAFKKEIADYQNKAKEDLLAWINDFVKQGYIQQDDQNYTVSVLRDQDVLRLSGKEVKME